jgi:hypothetical protein
VVNNFAILQQAINDDGTGEYFMASHPADVQMLHRIRQDLSPKFLGKFVS